MYGANIKLPELTCFFRANPCVFRIDKVNKHEYNVVLPQHSHDVQPMTFTGELEFNKKQSNVTNTDGCGGT